MVLAPKQVSKSLRPRGLHPPPQVTGRNHVGFGPRPGLRNFPHGYKIVETFTEGENGFTCRIRPTRDKGPDLVLKVPHGSQPFLRKAAELEIEIYKEAIERGNPFLPSVVDDGIVPPSIESLGSGIFQKRTLRKLVGMPYIITEYTGGINLERLIEKMERRREKLPIEAALYILDQKLKALARFKKTGILNNDIKPGNTMITEEAEVKILDMGIAEVAYQRGSPKSKTSPYGTPNYMAPERFNRKASTKSDIFSLAVEAIALLTKRLPFEVYDLPIPPEEQISNQVHNRAYNHKELSSDRADLELGIQLLILWGLEPEAKERPDPNELRSQLQRLVGKERIQTGKIILRDLVRRYC
jgi:serine/threonine protein kinase